MSVAAVQKANEYPSTKSHLAAATKKKQIERKGRLHLLSCRPILKR